MIREELFRDLNMDTSKMTTEELFRQTGRTSRMVEDAIKTLNEGRDPVVIVMKDEHMVKTIAARIGAVPGLSITHYNPLRPIIDWSKMQALGVYSRHKTFIDHDVIYFNNRALFEAASKYDPKFDIKGDAMYFVDKRPSAETDNSYAVSV